MRDEIKKPRQPGRGQGRNLSRVERQARKLGVPRTLYGVQRDLTAKALQSARGIGLRLNEGDLSTLVRLVQANQAQYMRTISLHRVVFSGLSSGVGYHFVYNNKFKLIEQFLSPGFAQFRLKDPVWWRDGKYTYVGVVVAILAPHTELKTATLNWTGYDLTGIIYNGPRPQETYLTLTADNKLHWPNVRSLRKGYRQDEDPR